MRKPTRAEGAMLATLLATGIVGGCAAHESGRGGHTQGGEKPNEAQESVEATAARLAWEKKMYEAREARLAIARRYASCAVIDVQDTHTSEKRRGYIASDHRGLPEPYEAVPRNKVVVTVRADLNPAAVAAEAKYANGTANENDVKWNPFSAAGEASVLKEDPRNSGRRTRAVPIPDHSTSEKTGPNSETFTITFYPRTDEHRTTNAEISLGTYVKTHDKEANNGQGATYVAAGRLSCGVLYEGVDIGNASKLEPNPLTWQVSQSPAEGIEEFKFVDITCTGMPLLRADEVVCK